MTKQDALQKIEELKKYIAKCDENDEWVKIDYFVIPKEVFDKYGAKPFEIMKKKMRNTDGEVWNNIGWADSKKEAEKLGYRLPKIQEMLVLLDWYKQEKGSDISCLDKEFLGIEELSYNEDVCYEWIDSPTVCSRGGYCDNGNGAGSFALFLNYSSGYASYYVGFRCAR
jgi:hypothetical protein